MKYPVLRIKRGKETYDDKEKRPFERDTFERETEDGSGSTNRPAKRRGLLFRIRRGSLLPLLILVVVAAIILRMMPRSGSRANIDGWHASLQAQVFGDTLEVGVGFSRLGSSTVDGRPQAVSVLFVLPDTGERVEAFGALSDSRAALKSRMRYAASEKTLRAVVRINGESRTLSLPITGP